MSLEEKFEQADETPNFVDFSGKEIEDEAITRPDDAEFSLFYDTFYGDSLAIYTELEQQGTQLIEGTDYELVNKHDRLSEDAERDVYTSMRIINADYIDQELYYNYTTLGDFTDFTDLQFLYDKIETLTAENVEFDDTSVSFTAEEVQTALQLLNDASNITFDDIDVSFTANKVQSALESLNDSENIAFDDIDVSYTAEEVQTALELLNKSDNIEFDNTDTLLDSDFVQQAIAEISGDADKVEFDDTDFFESQSTVQSAIQALSSAGVVDEGSTSDGDYIRYENGWQICMFERVDNVDYDTSIGALYRAEHPTWNFPVEFNNLFCAFAQPFSFDNDRSNRWYASSFGGTDNEKFEFRTMFYEESLDDDVAITLFAIGRWK